MIVMEERPEHLLSSGIEEMLSVERTDITFHDLAGDRVRIKVKVQNTGSHRSPPAPMRIESAPLGAFVPWRPLARLLVPSLEPGESRVMTTEVARPRPRPLGDFNRVPPRRVLTALQAPDRASRQAGAVGAMLNLVRSRWREDRAKRTPGAKVSLATDLWDLSGRGQLYWAGNINVFIGRRAVERHLARALRIYPGRVNLAMFVVGDPGKRDAYAFEVAGLMPDWKATLHDMSSCRSLVVRPSEGCIEVGSWVESSGGLMVILSTQPPAGCSAGKLEVHVTQRSCGKTAIVEFDLDPGAQGAGCYFA